MSIAEKRPVLGWLLAQDQRWLPCQFLHIRALVHGYISFRTFQRQSWSEALTTFPYTDPGHYRCNVTAAAKVFLDYGDFIRKVVHLKIQDEYQADDLLQDFFLSLVSNPLPREVQNIESYLHKAIANDIIEAIHKKRKYRNCIHEYAECYNHLRSEKRPETTALEVEEANRIFELVKKQLPPTEAQAVCYRYRDGLSNKKIAEKMCLHCATARGYVSEGLSRIRRLLKDLEARAAE